MVYNPSCGDLPGFERDRIQLGRSTFKMRNIHRWNSQATVASSNAKQPEKTWEYFHTIIVTIWKKGMRILQNAAGLRLLLDLALKDGNKQGGFKARWLLTPLLKYRSFIHGYSTVRLSGYDWLVDWLADWQTEHPMILVIIGLRQSLMEFDWSVFFISIALHHILAHFWSFISSYLYNL